MRHTAINFSDHTDIPDQRLEYLELGKSNVTMYSLIDEYNATCPCIIINSIFEQYVDSLCQEEEKNEIVEVMRTPIQMQKIQTPPTAENNEAMPPLELPKIQEQDSNNESPIKEEFKEELPLISEQLKDNIDEIVEDEKSSLDDDSVAVENLELFKEKQQNLSKSGSFKNGQKIVEKVRTVQYESPISVFSYNCRKIYANEPPQKETVVSREQIKKSLEIACYLKGFNNLKCEQDSHPLYILDSLKMLSDCVGVEGETIQELVNELLQYFSRIFGFDIYPAETFCVEQLHTACLDYIRLGYGADFMRHEIILK